MPRRAAASWATNHPGRLGSQMARVSPLRQPERGEPGREGVDPREEVSEGDALVVDTIASAFTAASRP